MLIPLLLIFSTAQAASKYYSLGSNRITTWNVDYGDYYYNELQFQIRLRGPANLIAFTWKNEDNCRNQYLLDHLNTATNSVDIPYSNSLVVHPWDGLGGVAVDARNEYCVGLYCYGPNQCDIEYDYYSDDGCWDYTTRCSVNRNTLDTTQPIWTCGRYHGCGCGWNTVWKCDSCWYGPCACGYHVVQCDCWPTCSKYNKRQLLNGTNINTNFGYTGTGVRQLTNGNDTIMIQSLHEDELLNANNYLLEKNISIDNCFQNNVAVYNRTYDEIITLRATNAQTAKELNALDEANKQLYATMIGLSVVSAIATLIIIGLMIFLHRQRNSINNN